MAKSARVPDPTAPLRAAGAELQELESQAGIAEQAQRARDVFPYDTHGDLPIGSPASVQQGREEEALGHRLVADRVRRLYFAVPDPETRRALISASRKVDDARNETTRMLVAQAADRVAKAVRSVPPLLEVVSGAIGTGLGAYSAHYFFGIGVALAYIAMCVFGVAPTVIQYMGAREWRIREADAELRGMERSAEDSYAIGNTFTRTEASSGTPDPRG